MLAHGGEPGVLPLPLYAFVGGSVLLVFLGFVALGLYRTEPPAVGDVAPSSPPPEPAGPPGPPGPMVVTVAIRMAAFAFYALCLYAAVFGTNYPTENIAPVSVYVLVWVGTLLVNGLVGDVWSLINPFDTLARLTERLRRPIARTNRPVAPTARLSSWGAWGAPVGIAVFLFYELSHPTGIYPRTLAVPLVVHAIGVATAGLVLGASWVRANEPFTVLFTTVARTSTRASARTTTPAAVAVLIVTLGGTAFDALCETPVGRDLLAGYYFWDLARVELALMVAVIAVVSALYAFGVGWAARTTASPFGPLFTWFAPALVPLVVGWALAHYARLLVDEMQSWWFRLSDPLGRGWDLFGASGGTISRVDPDAMVYVQVAAIAVAHLVALATVHDRALRRFPTEQVLPSQFGFVLAIAGFAAAANLLLLTG